MGVGSKRRNALENRAVKIVWIMSLVWVTQANLVENFKIAFEFNDSKKGIIDFSLLLNKPIYQTLKDSDQFKRFRLNEWTIEWENGADFSPEYLYELIEKQKDE